MASMSLHNVKKITVRNSEPLMEQSHVRHIIIETDEVVFDISLFADDKKSLEIEVNETRNI